VEYNAVLELELAIYTTCTLLPRRAATVGG